jgi:hypothetical protein
MVCLRFIPSHLTAGSGGDPWQQPAFRLNVATGQQKASMTGHEGLSGGMVCTSSMGSAQCGHDEAGYVNLFSSRWPELTQYPSVRGRSMSPMIQANERESSHRVKAPIGRRPERASLTQLTPP